MAKKTSAKVWFHAQGQRAKAQGFNSVRAAMIAHRIIKRAPAHIRDDEAIKYALPYFAVRAFSDGYDAA